MKPVFQIFTAQALNHNQPSSINVLLPPRCLHGLALPLALAVVSSALLPCPHQVLEADPRFVVYNVLGQNRAEIPVGGHHGGGNVARRHKNAQWNLGKY